MKSLGYCTVASWLFKTYLETPSCSITMQPTSMMDSGGWKQRLERRQRHAAARSSEQPLPPSHLAELLMEQWAWGEMSAPMVQGLAEAAMKDGLAHPEVQKLAQIGTQGKHPANTHRDLLYLSAGNSMVSIASSQFNITLQLTRKKSGPVPLDFLLPHKLFSCIYEHFPKTFTSSLLGADEGNVPKFWEAMKKHPVVLARPDLRGDALNKLIPLAPHGDGVKYMQATRAGGKSMEVLSWSSLLGHGPTKITNFLMFIVVKSLVKSTGFSQTWPQVWRVLIWSLEALRAGVSPLLNYDGQLFADETSLNFQKRGTPLADGYGGFIFLLKSDVELLAQHFKLNSPGSNEPCALCQANRDMQSRPWTDVGAGAAWRPTTWTRQSCADAHPAGHPFFHMQGSGIDLVFPDLMHCKHLGTDQLLLGSVLTWLIKQYLPGTISENLEAVWNFIQEWHKVDGESSRSGRPGLQGLRNAPPKERLV